MVEIIGMEQIALLFVVGMLAGGVDAISGGGGLLTVPALLAVGLTPLQALATNKLQAPFGTLIATINFFRKGHIELAAMLPVILFTAVGAVLGSLAVQESNPQFLINLIPFLLLAVALYFLLYHQVGASDSNPRLNPLLFQGVMGLSLGFYDGFFGPGTGSFWILAFVTLLGFNLVKATAHTKVVNLTSNISSLLFFILGGHVIWAVGVSMAAGQLLGGYLGSHMVMKHGSHLVRPLLVIVSVILTIKLVHAHPEHLLHQAVSVLLGMVIGTP